MSYVGKDIVHFGCGLELDPEKAMNQISHAARKNIKKGEESGVEVKRVSGNSENLDQLNAIWYHPEDPNFPKELSEDDLMYFAYEQDQVIGGMILIAVGRHFFLNNLAANEAGKKHQAQSLLLWHAVNDLKDSSYAYIDVGVSYRPNLYRFFKSWATFKYPVIFNPPELLPNIKFRPFSRLEDVVESEIDEGKVKSFCLNRSYTIVPSLKLAKEVLQKKNAGFKVSTLPDENIKDCQVIDLPQVLSTMYGAVIVGLEVGEKELWNDFGCFDFVKTEHVKTVLSHLDNQPKRVQEDRHQVFETYTKFFEHDEVELKAKDSFYSAIELSGSFVGKLAAACSKFGVEHVWQDEILTLPCHQNLSFSDVEYIYGIYRGVLNLCSEWAPTHVRGSLKDV